MIQPYMHDYKIYIMCYYFVMQHNPNPLGVGIYKKGLYYTECGEMTDGCW
jgi:hypothetical protein